MARELDFFFDFMSPPTYLAWTQMPGLVARTGAKVNWKPMFTIGLHQLTGNRSPREVPNKGRWMTADLQRWARRYGVPMGSSSHIETLKIIPPLRGAFVALERGETDAYIAAMFKGMWLEDENIGDAATFPRLIAKAGLDPAAYVAGIERADIKEALKASTQEAADRGAFGAPSFFVNGELFWGQDRLEFVEQALMERPA
jgi:2-hydroxychromene-2-carboxylate isomerase